MKMDRYRMRTSGFTTFVLSVSITLAVLVLFGMEPSYAAAKSRPFTERKPKFNTAMWITMSKTLLKWTEVDGATGYIVYRRKKSGTKFRRFRKVKGEKSVRLVLKNKKNKKAPYVYKVRAYKVRKGKKTLKSKVSNNITCVKYKKSRLYWLFPDGVPKSQGEMSRYLTTVRLKVRKPGGGTGYISIKVHKKLKKKIKACFSGMYKIKFPVRAKDTGSYNWRKMRTSDLMSHHSYGCVVDLNWQSNPMIQNSQIGHSAYKPGKDPCSITKKVVKIWKGQGFYWGGDWTDKKDYMHLTYTNG